MPPSYLVTMVTEQNNPPTWVQMDADSDDDLYAISRKLPLYVSSFSLSMAINDMAVCQIEHTDNPKSLYSSYNPSLRITQL